MKLKKTYKFAFKSSLYITLFSFIVALLLEYLLISDVNLSLAVLTAVAIFIFSFLVIQYRVEHFIYKRVKKIYEDVSMSKIENPDKMVATTDMETLSKKVKKFAEDKHTEIERLQLREEYRREFLGNVSHELKTPLFTVQGYLLTLSDGAINDKLIRDKYLKRANIGLERLVRIVEDLDMINQLESGNLNLSVKQFNIVKLISNVFELLEFQAKKRNIKLQFDKLYETPVLVKGDRNRIEQVLINLIENSIKYGKIGSKTTVKIKNFSDTKFIIDVKDEGEGIPERNLSRIFERFYRIEQSRSREQGGSGLGLSIVKHIMEAHQQKVFAKSELGKGSTFSFTLEKFK
ncbi:ATP-binding protein [Aureibaculum sp. 2210JD6-5]|uniref:sensor histidine kinase n=1 Tax=Aureibaculum sp. 2210JD6-5 TaxID=3103957 RepID=UPI002AAE6CB8|nr:ATP-binding protein [Aureibaculum sp. 2210JD6-5]MDY7396182.1 ATP-binding protein [Aureibaculum sp. 2210JD6-5]